MKKANRRGGSFSFEKVKDFEGHIGLSIPNYDILFKTILGIADYFLEKEAIVYDIGCSTGKLLRALKHKGRKEGFDNSSNLLPIKVEEGSSAIAPDGIQYHNVDLNDYEPSFANACLVLSLFTLQFLSRDARDTIVENVSRGLRRGGAFIIAEKVFAPTSKAQEIFTFTHYDYKREGFSAEEILRKEISLRRMLHPLTSEGLVDLLNGYDLKPIPFWKFLNFEAWLCIKD